MPDEKEVSLSEIPIPFLNYLYLIRDRKSPYYEVIEYILKEMETYYRRAGSNTTEVIYSINPRRLQREIEEKVKSEKLTTINISRTILALLYGSDLKKDKDYYVTTSSRGRRNYHIRVNAATLMTLRRLL